MRNTDYFVLTALLSLGYPVLVGGVALTYSTDLETELRTTLFTGYEVLQRPSQTVYATVELNLLYINSLDIKSQTLSTSGYFSVAWTDSRLDWSTNTSYSNVRFLFSSETYMWRPAVVIENSNSDLEIFSDTNSLIRIVSTGRAVWNPGGVFETHCEADVTYYPLDTQECSIILTTWAYTSQEVYLTLGDEPIILDEFKENGEWEIVSTSTETESKSRGKDSDNSYSRLYFKILLKRRPLFHILNTLFPVIIMASLICFVFKLPPESGERVGMSLTVLLAYAVYLTLISDNIPQTSLHASVLSTYLTIILMLSALSVVFTIIVLDIYFNHEDDEELPVWVQQVTRSFLVKVSCWKGESCCKKRRIGPDNSDIVSVNSKVMPGKTPHIPGDELTKTRLDNEADEDNDEKMYSWKEVALILDKCFMYVFIIMVVICTTVCVGILASRS